MKRILMNCSYNDELRIALIEGSKLYDLDNDSDSKSLLQVLMPHLLILDLKDMDFYL
jgi:hypothetical protein